MSKIELKRVKFMPKVLEPGILYVSEEYNIAGHLCPCGCGNKVMTPLGDSEWSFNAKNGKASLYPSLGNWQLPCRSHYWIRNGVIDWSFQWTAQQIDAGYKREEEERKLKFDKPAASRLRSFKEKLFSWIGRFLKK